jgi:maltooligosyltrehalose trehalohydrolase
MARRLPVGAEVQPGGGAHFRVWAPKARKLEVLVDGGAHALAAEPAGYFSGAVPAARAGSLYRFRIDGERDYPDPASRSQPQGPHGPSRIIDPTTFAWTDGAWRGATLKGQVMYEMHVGTFTPEGTWAAAARQLPELARLGITTIEMMPVGDFCGEFGWGYDGVNLFAPTRLYGEPDDLRRFVDAAHAAGIAVTLDVVYNHLGPDGNYLKAFSDTYFSSRYKNEWGEPLNFDGDGSAGVRELFTANARYWIEEFHFDGLRLDATQQIFDSSAVSILTDVTAAVRNAGGSRSTLVVAENEPQHVTMVSPVEEGGHGMDAIWNDDFHHSARVAATGHNEAYYSDYQGTAQELVSAVKWGFLFQGQVFRWQKKRRGSPTYDMQPQVFVDYLENHDQVANSGHGRRLHELAAPGVMRALTTLLLLGPGTPMLFQGQEFASSRPFIFFANHKRELAEAVRKGRGDFVSQFPSTASVRGQLPDPGARETFERCKLDFGERERHAAAYALHCDLLKLRREDPVFSSPIAGAVDGAVLSPKGFVLRFFAEGGEDRLLLVNLGGDLAMDRVPEPLLAPPRDRRWKLLWSSEDPRYGGGGTGPVETDEGWRVPGFAALALAPEKAA